MPSRVLLLDADSLTYSLALGHQFAFKWTNELYTYKGDMAGARLALRDFILSTSEALHCDSVRVALTDNRANFRKRVMGVYKAQRVAKDKPVLYKALRDELREHWGAVILPGLEGDDLVSMWATEPDEHDKIVCSIDKDCQTIPGTLYNPNTGRLMTITDDGAEMFFLGQVLTGDKVDGYSGCPGIGPKRAEKLLAGATPEEAWSRVVVPAYAKAGLSEAVALANARCARLLRWGDLMPSGAIRLWHPRSKDEWLTGELAFESK